MERRQLEYFLAVVDSGGFTRAAVALHVSQPSLSQAIKLLERELGTPLLRRMRRSVLPTPAGSALIEPARQVIRDFATARAAVEHITELGGGELDIVCLATLAVDPLAEMIGAFTREHPRVRVNVLDPEDVSSVPEMIRSGTAEIGLTELPVADPGLVAEPLGRQDVLAVLPPRSATPRPWITPAGLAPYGLVVSPPGTSTRAVVDRALAAEKVRAQIAVQTSHREALVEFVLAGAGATLLPRSHAEHARRRGAVVLPLRPALHRTIGLLYRAAPPSPAAREFWKLVSPPPARRRRPR